MMPEDELAVKKVLNRECLVKKGRREGEDDVEGSGECENTFEVRCCEREIACDVTRQEAREGTLFPCNDEEGAPLLLTSPA